MEANTVVFRARDGAEMRFPLKWLIEKGAVVADKINGEDISQVMHAANQLWIPGFPAKYFIRDIVGIEFLDEEEPPDIPSFAKTEDDYTNRPNVAASGPYVGTVGEPMVFRGWASDYDKAIERVQLSMDGGTTWTDCDTPGATAERMVFWSFTYTPETTGVYQLRARAVNEDGDVSPQPAVHDFTVGE